MKLLNVIFSYNRPWYLRNAVESMREVFRFGEILIMDDGSDVPEMLDYLAEVERQGVTVIRALREAELRYHGGLYNRMNEAVAYAQVHGFDLLQLIQDDMQCLWHNPNIVERVTRIFDTHADALQVQNLFSKRLMKHHLIEHDRAEFHEASRSYHFRPYGVGDLGFLLVPRLTAVGFRFLKSESENCDHWRRQGFKMYALHAPNLAFVPWPYCIQFNRRYSPWPMAYARRPVGKFFLTLLTEEQIGRLESRPLRDFPFLEDYSRPWGWRCLSPYWFTRFSTHHDVLAYLRLLWSFWRHGERLLPRWVQADLQSASRGGL